MKLHYAFVIPLLLALLSACASVGITPPQSLDQRLAYAAGQVTGIRSATANALDAKTITSQDAEKVLKMTDESKALIDAARAANSAGDVQGAEGRLTLAINVLAALQAYLGRTA